jgi:hypothetical protein
MDRCGAGQRGGYGGVARHRIAVSQLQPELFGYWIHSHEEDTPGTRAYRQSGFPFPPARGRTGFELRPGGEWIRDAIAPTEGSDEVRGRWTVEGPGRLRVIEDDSQRSTRIIEIISLEDGVLRIRA